MLYAREGKLDVEILPPSPALVKPVYDRHEQFKEAFEEILCFTHDELAQCYKVSLDIFWLKDESLEDSATCALRSYSHKKYGES